MKYWLSIYLLLLSCTLVKGQTGEELSAIDYRAMRFPMEITYSTTDLASYIEAHFTGNKERIRAAYRWVTYNITYDRDSMLSINWSKDSREKIAATLRRKKGVCDNFSSVYADILSKMNIPSFVVNGFAKGSGKEQAHSWNALQLEGEWFLCDPTWDAGFNTYSNYFLKSPDQFIATHWPFDPLWQLLAKPVTLKEFNNGFISSGRKENFYSISDSVKLFMALDSLQQLEATARRMEAFGMEENNLRTWYAYNNMNIAIIYGEQDMNLYNAAIADLNKANAFLNEFINYRNNFFKPAKDDKMIRDMLQPIEGLMNAASKKMEAIGRVKENFQYDTGFLKDRINATGKKFEQQNLFLNRYFESSGADRDKVFYEF